MSEPPFVMSMYASKADLFKAKSEYFAGLLKEALNEFAIKNDLSKTPENHWTRKVLDQLG